MSQQDERRWKKPQMVGWFDPSQLARTGLQAVLSTMLGSMIDTRRFGAVEGTDEDCILQLSPGDGEGLWFDYLADTGDGWSATYTMAYLLSSTQIKLATGETLPRADVVLCGGDQVYPVASKLAYAQRLVWPFNEAARRLGQYDDEHALRELYCTPGNHDWYDSLAAFTRRFCSGRRIGCFKTRQTRSYFVLKLPHHWQIWATDIQLGHDMDVHQLKFFRHHAASLTPQDRIIVCMAEPDWVYGERSNEDLHFNLERLERLAEARGAKVRLELAGDIHNYQRYEGVRDPDPEDQRPTGVPRRYQPYAQTKIVAGGGGAFLHPTHTFASSAQASGKFVCEERYPDRATSKRLSWQNVWFAFKNWKMAGLLGLMYLALFWSVPPHVEWRTYAIEYPGSLALALIFLAGLWAFADLQGIKRFGWGFVHWAAHLAMALVIWDWAPSLWPASWLVSPWLQLYLPRISVLVLGALVGGSLFGLYLLVSLNVLKIHTNDAFAALRIPHYKHFLRCQVTAEGLKIYVIGVERVATDSQAHPVATHLVEVVNIHNCSLRTSHFPHESHGDA